MRERMGRLEEKEKACITSPRTLDQETTLALRTHEGDMEMEEFSST